MLSLTLITPALSRLTVAGTWLSSSGIVERVIVVEGVLLECRSLRGTGLGRQDVVEWITAVRHFR